MSRTSVKPPRWGAGWPESDLVQVEKVSAADQDAEYAVFLNEERIGMVSCSVGRATVRIKGTRQVKSGGIERRWHYRLASAPNLLSSTWAPTRAEAIEDMIRELRRPVEA